jgi:hypothetical protein
MYLLRKISLIIAMLITIPNLSSELINAEIKLDKEHNKIVSEFLPTNSELVEPKKPLHAKSIQQYDFDRDGQNELVVTFKEKGEPNQLKAMMLKKEGEQWEKVWEITGKGFDIHYSGFSDITGDGIKEYIIGWMIGASAGNELEIFQWQDNSLQKISGYSFYHKLETLTQGKQTRLAMWERFCCDAYTVDVLRWDSNKLVLDEKTYAEYYPKIKEFYKNKIKEMDAWFYWYALADAQIKANLLEEARSSIQKGLSFNLANKEFTELQKRLEKKKN